MPPRPPEGWSGLSGVDGGVLGVVLVGDAVGLVDVLGRLVGVVVGSVDGGAVGTVGGRFVATGMVGSVVCTICGVGVPSAGVGYGVLRPTGTWTSPVLVALGNGVGTAVGVTPGVAAGVVLVWGGSTATFSVGSPGCGPAIGAAGSGPPPGNGRKPAPIRGPPSRAMRTSVR